nr:hypothetical protein K-LCC10_0330 [Kaumoebavirus]
MRKNYKKVKNTDDKSTAMQATHPYEIDTFGNEGQYLQTLHLKTPSIKVVVQRPREQEMQYLLDILADPRVMPWSFPQGQKATFSFQTGEATISDEAVDVYGNLYTPQEDLRAASIEMYNRLSEMGEVEVTVGATDSDAVSFDVNGRHYFIRKDIDGEICYGNNNCAWFTLEEALENN